MSTNFYFIEENGERLHIGKRSGGWKFLFAGHKETGSFVEWLLYLNSHRGLIQDEYGKLHTLEDFLHVVEDLHNNRSHIEQDSCAKVDALGHEFLFVNFC